MLFKPAAGPLFVTTYSRSSTASLTCPFAPASAYYEPVERDDDDDDDFLLQKASLVGSLMRAESYII